MENFETELDNNADLHFKRLFPPVRQEKALKSALIEIADALGCECSELRQMLAYRETIDAKAAEFRAAHAENPWAVSDIDNGWPKGAQPAPAPHGLIQQVAALEGRETGLSFRSEFIEAERLPDETDSAADQRLLSEYEDLEARRPLSANDEARRVQLHQNFYEYRG